MKLNIFYSWQSDLPNSKNRGLIDDCLEKAANNVFERNKNITEYTIVSDGRDETGTPDIVRSIFSKIDVCDIFVADISIINGDSPDRRTSNPNVLTELGYAASAIGWQNILCIFNDEYGRKDELPFDIRFRKPLSYNSADKTRGRKYLTLQLEQSIERIIETRLSDKKYYNHIKTEVDLALQAVLFDILKMLYFWKNDHMKLLAYPELLHSSEAEIECSLRGAQILGFQLFKNWETNISDFTEFFNDGVRTYFLNEEEKGHIARIITVMKKLKDILYSEDVLHEISISTKYAILSAHEMNSNNPRDSFILIETIDNKKGIVRDSGSFNSISVKNLTKVYEVKDEYLKTVASLIHNIIVVTNDWIRKTGGQFIFNSRLLEAKHLRNHIT